MQIWESPALSTFILALVKHLTFLAALCKQTQEAFLVINPSVIHIWVSTVWVIPQ